MRNFINFIKRDFGQVRSAIDCMFTRTIPLWVVIVWYVVFGILILPISLPIMIGWKLYIRHLIKSIEKEEA